MRLIRITAHEVRVAVNESVWFAFNREKEATTLKSQCHCSANYPGMEADAAKAREFALAQIADKTRYEDITH